MYDVNYNIGQSYYKPTLDRLDRKYYGKQEASTSGSGSDYLTAAASPKLRFNLDDSYDGDLQSARSRASRAITEDSVFDSRGVRSSRGLPLSSAFEDDLDEDDSLNRIRANRPKIASLINDLDLEDSFSKVKRRGNIDLGEKLLGVAGEDDIGSSIRSRALKMVSARSENVEEPTMSARSIVSSFKRTTISSDLANESSSSSAASMRAKASVARLADIESEMSERSDKLLERERRAANLKKLLAENDIEEVKSTKKVTF